MYNKFMAEKEINVRIGDRVAVQGHKGTVIDVLKGHKIEWNGSEYVKVDGSEYTNVKVHFDDSDDLSQFGQYQDKVYGGYSIIE